jgi:hypothetical protein
MSAWRRVMLRWLANAISFVLLPDAESARGQQQAQLRAVKQSQEAFHMSRVNVELFSPSGRFLRRVSRLTASQMIAEGSAHRIDQRFGRWCLRQTAEAHRRESALSTRDILENAGLGTPEEILAAKHRIIAHRTIECAPPREVTS